MASLPRVAARAKAVWEAAIETYGRTVTLRPLDPADEEIQDVKAFCTRPKILGLFDRTEQSFDQTRFIVQFRAMDVPEGGVEKFDRIRWSDTDHAVISVTEVVLSDVVIGYRFLVKG